MSCIQTYAREAIVALFRLGSRQVSQSVVLLLNIVIVVGKG
jgi:hypothetical protein